MAGIDKPQSTPDDPNAGAGKPRGRKARGQSSPAWFGTLGQLDFDIDFFERVLARKPDSIEVLRILAELVSKKGLVGRAVELDRNLACSFARAGRSDDAIDALSRAILLGYDDLDHMESDPDLESIRKHPDFLALLGD